MDGQSTPLELELLAQSRVAPAYFVVACRGKNASAPSSSARRRAIPDARSCYLGLGRREHRRTRRRRVIRQRHADELIGIADGH